MPNILYPPPRPQSVGEILDSAFRIFRATLLKCLPYATVAVIASQLPNIYYLATGRGASTRADTRPGLVDAVCPRVSDCRRPVERGAAAPVRHRDRPSGGDGRGARNRAAPPSGDGAARNPDLAGRRGLGPAGLRAPRGGAVRDPDAAADSGLLRRGRAVLRVDRVAGDGRGRRGEHEPQLAPDLWQLVAPDADL